jgi:hypothetical protein
VLEFVAKIRVGALVRSEYMTRMRTRLQEAKGAKDRAGQVLEPLVAYLLAAEQEEKSVMACLRGTSRALRGALDAGRREMVVGPSCVSSPDALPGALPRLLSRVRGLRALSVRVRGDAPSDLRMADGFAAGVRGLRSLRSLGLFGRAPAELLSGALCEALSALTELRLQGSYAADARREPTTRAWRRPCRCCLRCPRWRSCASAPSGTRGPPSPPRGSSRAGAVRGCARCCWARRARRPRISARLRTRCRPRPG